MKLSAIILISFFAVIALSGLGVGLYFVFRSGDGSIDEVVFSSTINAELSTSDVYQSTTSAEPLKGAVATSSDECTDASVIILQKGGSAVDSAITATFCQGLVVPQSSGLGGGFLATIYIKETGIIETLNAREIAPAAASKDMYKTDISSREGGLAVAVPTELKGLFELHKKYGKLKWEEVIQPVIEIAEKGYKVNHYLAQVLIDRGVRMMNKPGFM